ncbi:MAG: DUF1702 family protein [Streptosporangiaceae bacterium]|nr:DUF1702 family protein [Streptosporangiaceae bacterium]
MPIGTICHKLVAPHPDEVTFARRGFQAGDAAAQKLLEQIGACFLDGLEYGMTSRDIPEVARRLEELDGYFRGFGYEGAAMALALLDGLLPGRRARLDAFIKGPAARHVYMAHVGAGWAMARLPRPLRRRIRLRDPLLSSLAMDGYGFHEAYFRTAAVVGRHERPAHGGSAVDPGVGRALWFTCGADVDHVAATIDGFQPDRRADLWSGAGLAATYAGGAGKAALISLAERSGGYRPHLAQGAAFAAKARLLAGVATQHTDAATRALCGLDAEEAARLTDQCLPRDPALPGAYQAWRRAIRECFTAMQDIRR